MTAFSSAQASVQATLFTLAETQRTEASWTEFINAMESGQVFEIDHPFYEHWQEILPPKAMLVRRCFRGGIIRRVDFVFAEGDGLRVGFWREGDRLFLQRIEEAGSCAT